MTTTDPIFATRPATGMAPSEPLVWGAVFVGAGLAGSLFVSIAPLAAYVWLIALFGFPHVISEMRYCDERFSGRSSRMALGILFALLAALGATRLAGTYGALDGFLAGRMELLFGAALAVAAACFMRRHRLLGFGVAAAVIYGALNHPIETFLIWAWLHNLTPLAFVAEALEGRARRNALLALTLPFFVLPGFIALGGLDWLALTLAGHDASAAGSAFGAGRKPLGSFLPISMRMDDALPLFQAAVVSQVMHYVAVILLLPRFLATGARQGGRLVLWPSWGVFYGLLGLAGFVSLGLYTIDFGEARSVYALAAALHSWIELPVFLLALGGGFTMAMRARSGRPDSA